MDTVLLRFLIWIVIKIKPADVDIDQLRIITSTKLLMDRRRPPPTWKQSQQKQAKNPMLLTMFLYAMMSIFIGVQCFLIPSMLLVLIIFFSSLCLLLVMTLITDFSSVLLDTTDNSVLIPKPISSRTIFLSRVLHIGIYLFQFFISLAFIPIIIYFFYYGWLVGVLTVIGSILTAIFSLFITYLVYGLLLRFTSEQKLKDIIGYFQIGATIFFMGSFQILPRFLKFEAGYTFEPNTFIYFYPPAWFAFMVESVAYSEFDAVHVLMLALSLIVPPAGLWAVMKYLAPAFSHKLASMGEASGAKKTTSKTLTKRVRSLSEFWNNLVTGNPTESAGFDLVWKITSRDKGFKMAFYPGIAYLFILFFVSVFSGSRNFATVWDTLQYSRSFLWLIYLPVILSSSAIYILPMYENFTASWVYTSSPIKSPGSLVSGGAKVILTKFFLPAYLLMFSFAFYVWGYIIVDDFILGLFNNLIMFYAIYLLSNISLPFSQKPNLQMQSGKFIKLLLQYILIAAMVGLHYLALKVNYVVIGCIPLAAIIALFLHKKLLELPWSKIKV